MTTEINSSNFIKNIIKEDLENGKVKKLLLVFHQNQMATYILAMQNQYALISK